MNETELREQIAKDIASIDLTEAKEISADYYMACCRMKMVAEAIVRNGLPK